MRIRKRSLLPFSLSSPPRMASDLFCLRGASVQKPAEAEDGDKEEARRVEVGVVREPREGELGEGGFDQRIDFGSTCLPSRRSDDWSSRDGVCDRAEEKCVEEVNQCCMLSAPILAPVEACRDAEEERCSAREKGNSRRNGNTKPPGAETSTADGRWEEREKVIPLKKRKGSLEWEREATAVEKQKKAKTKTKRPTKKKVQEEEEEKPAGAASEAGEVITSVGKKGRRGNNGGLMEGSRCSRINGRGWRCCQQTLVGYSLCEHHLGKGRLRSMNSFPSRASTVNRPAADSQDNNAGSSDKSEAQMTASKGATKKKIGMVKARSISSLLGLSTAAILSTDGSTTAPPAAITTAATATSS